MMYVALAVLVVGISFFAGVLSTAIAIEYFNRVMGGDE